MKKLFDVFVNRDFRIHVFVNPCEYMLFLYTCCENYNSTQFCLYLNIKKKEINKLIFL